MKLRKVRGVSTSQEGRAELHQAVDENVVRVQELRCAKEGLFTTEDAESAAGFRGQLRCMACQRRIMADRETQKLE